MLRSLATLAAAIAVAIAFPSPAPASADASLARQLRGLVAAPGGPPGAIAVVQHGERRRVFSAGVAQLGRERRPRANQRMRIASVSKAFSGAAALTLVRRGELALSDTIGERLPSLPAAWHEVTLAELLQHTSGLPDFTASRAFAEQLTASPRRAPAPRRLLALVEAEPLQFAPGSAYRYSNSDNVAVGLMVARVSGSGYRKALDRLVVRPLGLASTRLPGGAALTPPFLHGYAGPAGEREDVSREVAFGGWAWASGGIVSTPASLNRFVRGYVGGRLFAGAARRAQRDFVPGTSEPPGPGVNAAGLALFRYRTRCGTVFGHTGSILGYTQLIAASADGRDSLTFTINQQVDDQLLPVLRRAQVSAVCAALGAR